MSDCILELKNALHILSNQNNLLSLARWEKHGQFFIGHHGKLSLYMDEGTVIARGRKIAKKLYHMDFTLTSPADTEETYNAQCSAPSWEIWHRRFGHVRYSGLQKLLENELVEGLEINKKMPKPDCIAYMEAKLSEASYGPATDRYTRPGQLLCSAHPTPPYFSELSPLFPFHSSLCFTFVFTKTLRLRTSPL